MNWMRLPRAPFKKNQFVLLQVFFKRFSPWLRDLLRCVFLAILAHFN